jgi:tetratricopeptide (TPR) repeat protein
MRTPRSTVVALALQVLAWAAAGEAPKDYAKELRQAQSLQQAKRYKDCLESCEKMLGHYQDPRQAKEITWLKIEALVSDGQHEAALKALADLGKTDADDKKLQATIALRAADVLVELKKLPEARAECQRLICSCPLEQAACQAAQARIVETYRAESKWPEALGAARVLYDAAGTEESLREAGKVMAQAFLAADGTLARANEFLAYQSFGPDGPDGKPNTDDDIKTNRLAEVKYPTLAAEANGQFEAAIKAQPDGYDGYRAKGFLYVYWGKPKEGAAQFRLAFKAASLAQVPAAAQELVLVGMKAHTASFRGLDRIFEYLNHGPKGKSGKENIPDPFAGL